MPTEQTHRQVLTPDVSKNTTLVLKSVIKLGFNTFLTQYIFNSETRCKCRACNTAYSNNI